MDGGCNSLQFLEGLAPNLIYQSNGESDTCPKYGTAFSSKELLKLECIIFQSSKLEINVQANSGWLPKKLKRFTRPGSSLSFLCHSLIMLLRKSLTCKASSVLKLESWIVVDFEWVLDPRTFFYFFKGVTGIKLQTFIVLGYFKTDNKKSYCLLSFSFHERKDI